mmetsp:Transcript_72555/g.200107  ORF Transcript_72555/g.200107 Transcript_72555/m.200107 type:complete len:202 (-) Transcript_72555:21-626(-)
MVRHAGQSAPRRQGSCNKNPPTHFRGLGNGHRFDNWRLCANDRGGESRVFCSPVHPCLRQAPRTTFQAMTGQSPSPSPPAGGSSSRGGTNGSTAALRVGAGGGCHRRGGAGGCPSPAPGPRAAVGSAPSWAPPGAAAPVLRTPSSPASAALLMPRSCPLRTDTGGHSGAAQSCGSPDCTASAPTAASITRATIATNPKPVK